MSFSEQELQLHCETIMQSRRAQGKIVVLCEGGDNQILKQKPRPSASAYRQQEKLPDANFYKACIPTWWKSGRPEFFVCGDRENVINTYFKLHELHKEKRNDSYLDKDKIFAIIDLDLQPPKTLENYSDSITNTEELFKTLYQQNIPQLEQIQQHSIFITGLIYKEAYFLIPELQTLFDNYHQTILFENKRLNLETLYLQMGKNLVEDKNLKQNFQLACDRINYLQNLDCSDINSLQNSWLQSFQTVDKTEKTPFIYALLSIHQIKSYWKALKTEDKHLHQERFKEQLTLAIGRFYSEQPRNSPHHLPSFFQALSNLNS